MNERIDKVQKLIAEYLQGGGLLNPELADHDAVRDLIMAADAELTALTAERDRLREAIVASLEIIRTGDKSPTKCEMVWNKLRAALTPPGEKL